MNIPSGKKTIYYDGDCPFCVGIIQKIGNSDRKEIFEPRDITKNVLPHSITTVQAHKEIHLVDADGTVYKNAEAILKILEQYPKWKMLVTVGRLPLVKQILSIGYAFIAANRHCLFSQAENLRQRGIKDRTCFLYQLTFFARERWGLDVRALAFTRMALALVVLTDLILRSRDLVAHYSSVGVLPGGPELPYSHLFYLFFQSSELWVLFFFILTGIAAVLLLFGYRTKFVTPLVWFLVASLDARNPLVLNSGDHALRLFLFWGMFLPWERR